MIIEEKNAGKNEEEEKEKGGTHRLLPADWSGFWKATQSRKSLSSTRMEEMSKAMRTNARPRETLRKTEEKKINK